MNETWLGGWMASLSNGATVREMPPTPGEKSSWQKMLDFIAENNLRVTQLRLVRGPITIICDHHKKCNGYCMAYEVLEIMYSGNQIRMQGIGSVFGDKVFMTWVDGNGKIRQEIRELSEMKVHTTLRDSRDTTTNNNTT